MINSLWCEKYRPSTLEGYVFSDPQQKEQLQGWAAQKDIPHLLFSGSPGTGKTTAAKILVNELDIDPYDLLFINASRENSVDDMRNRITSFVSTMPFGKMRVVILDECDYLSPNAQGALRGVMEQYSSSSRFILTCNYPTRIIPAIHSRTQSIEIHKLELNEFTAKMAEILISENVQFELDVLDDYVRGSYPDMRKSINNCQQHSINGILQAPIGSVAGSADYLIEAVAMFKANNFRGARELICKQIRAEELEEFFRFLYDNLDLWGETPAQKDAAILVIRKGLVQIPMVADPEILCAAVLVELSQIS